MTAEAYETVVGLEIHVQLATQTKLFCADSTAFGLSPNSQVSPISLGHPGTLPRLNKEAVTMAIKLGLALHGAIPKQHYFARKHYFYPDLPKGYQISQHTAPISSGGYIDVRLGETNKRIRLHHLHLEEDAGKSVHHAGSTKVDGNRAGMPLVEVVTEPDMRSAEEAFEVVKYLRKLVRRLGVGDGDMEKGNLRCDVNISVRKNGDPALGTKVEIKNLNSLRFIKKAIEWESKRLRAMLQNGETVVQQTRGFDETHFTTYPIRNKENEDDYRYFPDPDLPLFTIGEEELARLHQSLPPSEAEWQKELQSQYGLNEQDAGQLAQDEALFSFYQQLVQHTAHYKAAANWTLGPVRRHLSESEEDLPETVPGRLAQLIQWVEEGKLNHGLAVQKVWPAIVATPDLDLQRYAEETGLLQGTATDELDALIEAALQKHAQKITEYKRGKKGLLSLFVGEVMKRSGGKADATLVTQKLTQKLNA